MLWLADSFVAIRDFMELGGPVLRWIAVVIFAMWVLIIERLLYFRSPMKIIVVAFRRAARAQRFSGRCSRAPARMRAWTSRLSGAEFASVIASPGE